MFDAVQEKLLEMGREAWVFLASITAMIALLGALFYVLKGSTGAAFGSDRTTAMAIIGAIGLIVLVLVGFLVIPEMGNMLQEVQPTPPF
jgi:hypothetical protein